MYSLRVCNILRNGALKSEVAVRGFAISSVHNDNHKCKVLVVGGGAGGCAMAAKLSSKLGEGKVTILEPADKHYYQPMFTLIGGGIKTLKDSYRPMSKVLPTLAKWVKDSAAKFEPENNTVYTANGDKIEYEFLLVATGLQLNYDKIPGLVDALSIPKGKVCSNYSPKYVDRTYQALQAFKSGNAIFTYPNSPVKCPGAPQKILYIGEHYLRKSKKRQNAKVIYNTSLPVIFGVKHYADQLWKIVEKRDIKVNLRTNLIEVIPDKNQAVFQNLDKPEETFTTDYEFLHVTPPMSAPDALAACKNLVTETGFVDVDKDTLQHVRYDNVFAIGDCSASPNSKTAASVAAQSQVVYKNMIAVMNGVKPSQVFNGYASCPLVTGYNTCIMAEFDYSLTPLETFPIDQSKERISMFYMKKDLMPPLYWHLLLNGLWNGPGFARKLMHFSLKDCLPEQKCLGYPSDKVVLTNKQQFLMVGQAYKVTLYLEMPESVQNDKIGMFTVCATMLDNEASEHSTKSCRLSMIHFKSSLLKMITTVVLAPFFVLGYREEKQTVAIDLFTHFEDSQAHPVTSVDISVLSRDIQFYSAQLHITANFSGLRYLMFNWPIISAVIGILTNLFFILIICVLSWYHWDDTEWIVEIKDRYHQILSTPTKIIAKTLAEPASVLLKEEKEEKEKEEEDELTTDDIEEVSSFKDDLGLTS